MRAGDPHSDALTGVVALANTRISEYSSWFTADSLLNGEENNMGGLSEDAGKGIPADAKFRVIGNEC